MNDLSQARVPEPDLPIVVHVEDDNDRVVINRGQEHGIKIGQRFLVFGIGKEIIDPRTKESLGKLETVRGTGKIVHIQQKMATLKSDMTFPGRHKIARPSGNIFSTQTHIEEEQDPPIEIPFGDPVVGDYAKPV
jgi:hypothetical protein